MKLGIPVQVENLHTAPRRSIRDHTRSSVFLVADFGDGRVNRKALILDFSENGARVSTDLPVTDGQTIEMTLPDGIETKVRCQVIWIGEEGSTREGEVGLEFLTPYHSARAA